MPKVINFTKEQDKYIFECFNSKKADNTRRITESNFYVRFNQKVSYRSLERRYNHLCKYFYHNFNLIIWLLVSNNYFSIYKL